MLASITDIDYSFWVAFLSSMAAPKREVTVFVDTTLGTRFAVAVPPEITAETFKRELEKAHYSCFPTIGEIQVHQLMVKRKALFYHLPDVGFMKCVRMGVKGEHFLHANVSSSKEKKHPCSCQEPAIDSHRRSYLSNANHSFKPTDYSRSLSKNIIRGSRKKRKRLRFYCHNRFPKELQEAMYIVKKRKRKRGSERLLIQDQGENILNKLCDGRIDSRTSNKNVAAKERNSSLMESSNETSSEVVSVTGIIKKYFPTFDDVKSLKGAKCRPEGCSNGNTVDSTNRATSLIQFMLKSDADRQEFQHKPKGDEIGKRFVMASYNLGVSPGKERPELSVCKSYRRRNLQNNCSSSLSRKLVFEISDCED